MKTQSKKRERLKLTSIQLSDEQRRRISRESKRRGESLSETIRRAIDEYFRLSDMIAARLITAEEIGRKP